MAKASPSPHSNDVSPDSNGHAGGLGGEPADRLEGLGEGGDGGGGEGGRDRNGAAGKEIDRFGFCGGNQYTDPEHDSRTPVAVIRQREIKWIEMFDNWGHYMNKRYKKVRDRCRKGIPPGVRPRAWQYLCGSAVLVAENKGRYAHYLAQPGAPQCIDDIRKDLDRQFPFHELFMARGGHGQGDLFDVLKALSIHCPKDGYCQAQAPIAAVLLMHMPAEQAFWCLATVCEIYLPGYYSPGLEVVQLDGEVLFGLLRQVSPLTYKHLKKQKIDPILCMTEWFMCVFTRTLPWPSVLRLWDIFLCEGVKMMFRAGLVLLKHCLGRPDQLARCPGMYETLEALRHPDPHIMQEDFFINECLRLGVSEREMEREHASQLVRWKAEKEKRNRPPAAGPHSAPNSAPSSTKNKKKNKSKKLSDAADSS